MRQFTASALCLACLTAGLAVVSALVSVAAGVFVSGAPPGAQVR